MSNNDLYCSKCKSHHHPLDCQMNIRKKTKTVQAFGVFSGVRVIDIFLEKKWAKFYRKLGMKVKPVKIVWEE